MWSRLKIQRGVSVPTNGFPALLCVYGAVAISLALTEGLSAQTFTILHNFDALIPSMYTNNDGFSPHSGLILSGKTLYGTTGSAGAYGIGTVFAVNTDGTGFTNLHSFDGTIGNAEGEAGLVLSGNTLYGTIIYGGIFSSTSHLANPVVVNGGGMIFSLNTNGGDFAIVHEFDPWNGAEGSHPYGGVTVSGGRLYGTTLGNGVTPATGPALGTVFGVNADGTGFATLHTFYNLCCPEINIDGAKPSDKLILLRSTLYGTARVGGCGGNGTVFRLNTDGTGFTVLHSFAGGTNRNFNVINSDGANPWGLLLVGSRAYGCTSTGGSSGSGTVFAVNADGTLFRTLHIFAPVSGPNYTNSDGASPRGVFAALGSTLYGTAESGGPSGAGTVFSINTDGSDFQVLHSFTGQDASGPRGLVVSGTALYGTAWSGAIFRISLPAPLTVSATGANLILTWPTNFTALNLQSTSNLGSPVWTTNSALPSIVNGQNTAINPILGSQQFFRLSQ